MRTIVFLSGLGVAMSFLIANLPDSIGKHLVYTEYQDAVDKFQADLDAVVESGQIVKLTREDGSFEYVNASMVTSAQTVTMPVLR